MKLSKLQSQYLKHFKKSKNACERLGLKNLYRKKPKYFKSRGYSSVLRKLLGSNLSIMQSGKLQFHQGKLKPSTENYAVNFAFQMNNTPIIAMFNNQILQYIIFNCTKEEFNDLQEYEYLYFQNNTIQYCYVSRNAPNFKRSEDTNNVLQKIIQELSEEQLFQYSLVIDNIELLHQCSKLMLNANKQKYTNIASMIALIKEYQ